MEKYEYKDLSEEEVSGLVTKLEIRRYLSKFSDFSPDGNLTDIEDETSRSCANDAQLEIWKIVRETPQNKPRIINELIKKGIELDAKKFATTVEHSRKGERWMDPVATGLMIGETLAEIGESALPHLKGMKEEFARKVISEIHTLQRIRTSRSFISLVNNARFNH